MVRCKGSQPRYVFEVKEGDEKLSSTKFYTLSEDRVEPVGPITTKEHNWVLHENTHSFAKYTCPTHQKSYTVHLYTST